MEDALLTRRAVISGLAPALCLLLDGFAAAWAASPLEVRIFVKGMVCPA